MLFYQPWMLLGLGLCALPVVIHLLSRRVYRRERWAAMRFLRAALDRHAKQLRLESLLLLLVRTLCVLVLVLAVAEPLFYLQGTAATRAPQQRILVVDLSASMGTRSDGERRMDRLRREVEAVLDTAASGDLFQLVRISALPPRTLIRRGAYDPDEVRAELSRWDVTEESGDVLGACQSVQQLLSSPAESMPREVVIISDLQRSNWWPEDAGLRLNLQRSLRDIAQRSTLKWVDVSGSPAGNLSVVSLSSAHPILAPDQPTEVTAVVRNHGRSRSQFHLEWLVNGKLVDGASREVDGGGEATVRITVSTANGASLQVEARLAEDDALAADNHRFISVPVRPALRVLVVEGRPGLSRVDGAAGFVALALAPSAAGAGQFQRRLPLGVEVISPLELEEVSLVGVDCLWMCDVPELPAEMLQRIAGYVRGGGGLVFAVGDQTTPEVWNTWHLPGGGRVLPALFVDAVDVPAEGTEFVTFQLEPLSHAATTEFSGNPQAGLETTRIRRYRRVGESAEVGRRVLSFSNGEPAILDHDVGVGRVVLVLTSVDDRWSNWAVWPSFLPLVHQLTTWAASGSEGRNQLEVASPIERSRPPSQHAAEFTLTDPAGQRIRITPHCGPDACEINIPNVAKAGFYSLESGPPAAQVESIAVNLPVSESIPAVLTEALLSREILPQGKFTMGSGAALGAAGASSPITRGSLSGMLLMTALSLLVIEKLMSWRSHWGVAAFALLGMATAFRQVWIVNPWIAAAMLLLVVAAAVTIRQRLRLPIRR